MAYPPGLPELCPHRLPAPAQAHTEQWPPRLLAPVHNPRNLREGRNPHLPALARPAHPASPPSAPLRPTSSPAASPDLASLQPPSPRPAPPWPAPPRPAPPRPASHQLAPLAFLSEM